MPNFTPKLEDTLASILEYLSSQEIAVIFNMGIGIGGTRVCIPASSLTNWVTLVKTHNPPSVASPDPITLIYVTGTVLAPTSQG